MNIFKLTFLAISTCCLSLPVHADNDTSNSQSQNSQQNQIIQKDTTPPPSEGPLGTEQIQPLLQLNGKS